MHIKNYTEHIRIYYNKIEEIRRHNPNEGNISSAFYTLLNSIASSHNLSVITQDSFKTKKGKLIRPDATIKNSIGIDFGYWEAKDSKDNLHKEIEKKLNIGYPTNNILFENGRTAVLYQEGTKVLEVENMRDEEQFTKLLQRFITYKPEEIVLFEKAIQKFKEDIPPIVDKLREFMDKQKDNQDYVTLRDSFLDDCKNNINPDFTIEDIREMIIQHILTKHIFNAIFGNIDFHMNNNIAETLESIIESFRKRRNEQINLIRDLSYYYDTITIIALKVSDYNDKQKFLKMIYEEFYKAYNAKKQDTLGIVYTPNEIVDFMVKATDTLLQEHFKKGLRDKQVTILDPCTGTGTFITSILNYIPSQYLEHKYDNEIFANELSILSYYIATLNIEYTYYDKMRDYKEFKNIVFADTLDNVDWLEHEGQQSDVFNDENTKRIVRQNKQEISVIIGNPPYNANQRNYNDQNANRSYPDIDKRIKDTFVKHSTARGTNAYDMYTKFIRWSIDRLKDNGIISFITNSSFIDSRSFDGFRQCIEEEFDHIYIINLKGNARTSGDRRKKESGNVFYDKIRVGICIVFIIKCGSNKRFTINYTSIDDYLKSEEKIAWIRNSSIDNLTFERLYPDKHHNWINVTDNDFDELIPAIDKQVKNNKSEEAIFKIYSLGVATNRDEWVYDFNKYSLEEKVKFFTSIYEKTRNDKNYYKKFSIKWDGHLEKYFKRDIAKTYEFKKIILSNYRPFVKKYVYFDEHFNNSRYRNPSFFGEYGNLKNKIICFYGAASNNKFHCLCVNSLIDLHFTGDSQCIPLYVYDSDGNKKHSNITKWGLEKFKKHYNDDSIDAESIFHYTYAILHDPKYREKYAIDLKRHFPRLPFKKDFLKWSNWGKELMYLHINFESQEPYSLDIEKNTFKGNHPNPKLKSYSEEGIIILDEETTLKRIPQEAWNYKLGNRSAIDWVLDQYKEKKIRDATIKEKFNTYRFRDYKSQVIDLLSRVVRISIETIKITQSMRENSIAKY